MKTGNSTTLYRIHEAAKAEFMEKGYEKASLRNIVRSLGMTTGAFYGYYKSKEELFEAIVGERYDSSPEDACTKCCIILMGILRNSSLYLIVPKAHGFPDS